MRQFYDAYRADAIVSPLLRQLPWTHHLLILGRAKRSEEREFYVRLATKERWSSRELQRQFDTQLFARVVKNPAKAAAALKGAHPAAAAIFPDRYVVDFLDLHEDHSEGDLHRGLVAHMRRFLLDLGRDFCFGTSTRRTPRPSQAAPPRRARRTASRACRTTSCGWPSCATARATCSAS